MYLKDFKKKNILTWDPDKLITWQDIKPEHISYIVVKRSSYEVYKKIKLIEQMLSRKTERLFLAEINTAECCAVIEDERTVAEAAPQLRAANLVLALDKNGTPSFVIESPARLVQEEETRNSLNFFMNIFSQMEEEIFVSDSNGTVLYMNPRSEKVCGIPKEECIGRNVRELQSKGIFSESITLKVLENHCKVEETVEVSTGRHIISTAIPIYNEDHQIEYVLCTSKDIKELNELMEKNALISKALNDSINEIGNLKRRVISEKNYIFESPSMKEVQKTVIKIAPTNVTVLIEGETGTGKGMIADSIHALSKRSKQPMMKINCGLIPADLLESELFGYMPGTFSGALKEGKIGIIEASNKGTLFLDEIGEMPLMLQVKLLDFLQDRKIKRLGGVKEIPIDVRVIAATNCDLKSMVEKGKFRKDLYYRLNVMPIQLKPLQERKEDIQPLAKMFLQKFNHEYHCNKKIKASVLNDLLNYSWPGNVRELMHVIERFVVSSEGDMIEEPLLREVLGKPILSQRIICTGIIPLLQAREELDYILTTAAVDRYGSTRKAASALGINQSTVVRILNKQAKKQTNTIHE